MKNENQAAETGMKPEAETKASRRSFLAWIAMGAAGISVVGQAFAFLRSLVPNVLYEEPRRCKIGTPEQYPDGAKYLETKRLFIFREGSTFYAISAVCPHLGCTVKMTKLDQPKKVKAGDREFEEKAEFACPCHGSKFYGDGTNYAGPAPRPLTYYKLEISAEDGQLTADLGQTVGRDFRLTV